MGAPESLRQLARAARVVNVGVGDDDELDVGVVQPMAAQHAAHLGLRPRQARIDQHAALRAHEQVAVHHAKRQDGNPDNANIVNSSHGSGVE